MHAFAGTDTAMDHPFASQVLNPLLLSPQQLQSKLYLARGRGR